MTVIDNPLKEAIKDVEPDDLARFEAQIDHMVMYADFNTLVGWIVDLDSYECDLLCYHTINSRALLESFGIDRYDYFTTSILLFSDNNPYFSYLLRIFEFFGRCNETIPFVKYVLQMIGELSNNEISDLLNTPDNSGIVGPRDEWDDFLETNNII